MESTNIEKVENLIKKGLDEISSNRKDLAIKFWEEALSWDPTLEQKVRLLQNLAKTIWEPFKFWSKDKNLSAEDTELFHLGEKYFHLLDDLTTGMKNRSEISVDALTEADETIEDFRIVQGYAATGHLIFPGDETLRRLMECGMEQVAEGEKMEEDEALHRLHCLSKAKELLDSNKIEHHYWAIDIAARMFQILAFDLRRDQDASKLFVEIVNLILDFNDQDFLQWAQSKNTNKFKLTVIEILSRAESGIEKLDDSIKDQYKRKTTYYSRLAWLLNMKGEPDQASAYAYKALARKMEKDDFQYTQMKAVLKACNKPLPTEKTGGCFIATAVYSSEFAPEVLILRSFRDKILHQSSSGRLFESCYYFLSPRIAKMILIFRINEFIRKFFINPLVRIVNRNFLNKLE